MNTVDDEHLLSRQMEAYERVRGTLELDHHGEWVIFYGGSLIGCYGSFEEAAESAVSKFGRGPYLIRRIGETPVALPAAALYGSTHAGA